MGIGGLLCRWGVEKVPHSTFSGMSSISHDLRESYKMFITIDSVDRPSCPVSV